MVKHYCTCGGKKMVTLRGQRRPVPCFWRGKHDGSTCPVGTGLLGSLHPQCFLAIGLFGLFDHKTQIKFEKGFRGFIEKQAQNYPLVERVYSVIPSPAKTRPNKEVDFNPTRYAPNGVPQSFSNNILQIILTACQRINSKTSLADLRGGGTFTGTLRGLWNTLYVRERRPFIEEMRGVPLKVRESVLAERTVNDAGQKRNGAYSLGNKRVQKNARHPKVQQELAQVSVLASFQTSKQVFDQDRIIMDDPNDRDDDAKDDFQKELRIDENWSPRYDAGYDAGIIARLTEQVLKDGLIPSEAVLQQGQHYALHATLTNPLGPEWKKVNGKVGILVATKTLQERAGMFPGEKLKTHDTCLWFTLCIKGVINRIRVKHWGRASRIPEGMVIYMAVIDTESVYYQKLRTFAISNIGCPTFHAMSAIHTGGPYVIPSHWVKIKYHPTEQLTLERLEYQPNVNGNFFDEVQIS